MDCNDWVWRRETVDSRKTFHLGLTNLGVVFLLLFKGKPVVQKL